ncbi:MFS transporter [Pedobacter cryotolerans]|uniref:MFS transporter n=1 Tax=Pedobacter cryotolerans TaxID=2571270 RepID=A0A4U1CCV2_9SPHI|nr:MFS transporter [Pedobacter cryotolerans]TKC01784.1 MFS transporter [Pedobacter cryotolerans]
MLRQILNTYKTSFTGLSRETWLLSGVILLNRCGYMAVPFMGLYVTQSLNRPESDAGLIISLFGVGAILGAAAGGKLTDMFGFRPVQIVSSVIGGLLFLAFSQITNFTALCVMSVLISFFYDAFRPANFAAIAAYSSPGNQTRSYSLNRLATNIGFSFGIAMGGLIASINYKLLFLVDGVVSILVGLAILLLLPAVKGFRKAAIEKTKNIIVRKPWQDVWFIKFVLLTCLFATCFFLMFRVVPVFFKKEWHIDEAMIGLILGVNGAIIALLEMVMISKIENKKSPQFYIVTGVLIVSVSFMFLVLPSSFPIVLALLCVIGFTFGEMFSMPFINTFVIKRSNEFNRGQYAAGFSIAWSVAQITPVAGFYIAEKLGYNTLWLSSVVLLLFCAYGYYSLNYNEQVTDEKNN